ncbi:MAG: hypothetical protein ABJE95_03680 [Byssovorax sp.]
MATSPATSTSSPPSYEDFGAAMSALGATIRDEVWDLDRAGRRFTVRWRPPHKSTPPRVEIVTQAGPFGQPQEARAATTAATAAPMGPFRGEPRPRIQSPAPLTLRLETGLDRLGKSLRINRETQTGDAAFDARVYLESDAADPVVLAALVDPTLRASAVKCLDLGCASVVLDAGGDLRVERPLPHAELIAADRLAALCDALGAAAEAIPPLAASPPVRSFAGMLPGIALIGLFGSWPLYYAAHALWEPLRSDLYSSSVLGGIALWLVSLPILFFVLRGRSVSLRDLMICTLALAVGLPLGGTDLMMTLNGLLDRSAPVIHETRVTRLHKVSGKSPSYYVTVPSWQPDEETTEISIGSTLYSTLAEGTPIVVRTHPGALGWEWLVDVSSAQRTWN